MFCCTYDRLSPFVIYYFPYTLIPLNEAVDLLPLNNEYVFVESLFMEAVDRVYTAFTNAIHVLCAEKVRPTRTFLNTYSFYKYQGVRDVSAL